MKLVAAGFAAVAALLVLPAASAKNFGPGDLRVCNKTRCVAIVDRLVLSQLSSFYYGTSRLAHATPPVLGVPYYQLRFRNGYATGIISTKRLDRFLSYGVNLDHSPAACGTSFHVVCPDSSYG